jgi:hypothetical protein
VVYSFDQIEYLKVQVGRGNSFDQIEYLKVRVGRGILT